MYVTDSTEFQAAENLQDTAMQLQVLTYGNGLKVTPD